MLNLTGGMATDAAFHASRISLQAGSAPELGARTSLTLGDGSWRLVAASGGLYQLLWAALQKAQFVNDELASEHLEAVLWHYSSCPVIGRQHASLDVHADVISARPSERQLPL